MREGRKNKALWFINGNRFRFPLFVLNLVENLFHNFFNAYLRGVSIEDSSIDEWKGVSIDELKGTSIDKPRGNIYRRIKANQRKTP